MKKELVDQIIEKAKIKEDGVYSHKGVNYLVKNKYLKFLAHWGTVYEFSHGFLVEIGSYRNSWEGKPILVKLLKKKNEEERS